MKRNYALEIQRLQLRKQTVLLSHATMELRLAELEEEKEKLSQNFSIYKADLENIEKEIATIESAKSQDTNFSS